MVYGSEKMFPNKLIRSRTHILFSTHLALKLLQFWRYLNNNYVYACPSIRLSAGPSYLFYTICKRTDKAGIQEFHKAHVIC
jgi:hypothetical protein